MNYKNIKIENRENYAIIEIANNKNNSLDQKTLKEISHAAISFNRIKKLKCIGLKGNSKFFSPGADVKELEKLSQKPIISFVRGYALGGGFELALSTDLIISSENAKFGFPEINLGIIPGIGGTQKTKRFTSNQNIKYLAMTGEVIDSLTAYKYGIVSQIIPDKNFENFSLSFLKKISSKPRLSLIKIKELVNLDTNFKNSLQIERKEFYKLLDSKNKKIGIKSFLTKKKPNWD